MKSYEFGCDLAASSEHDSSVMLIFEEAEGIDANLWDPSASFADTWVRFYAPTKAKGGLGT